MMNRSQLDLLWNIEIACRRCITASCYFDITSGTEQNLWAFTQNCYGEICVIHWCKVFGARSEPTHYSRLFDTPTIACISKHQVAIRLHTSVTKTEAEYTRLWRDVKKARDKFLVHNEFSLTDKPIFPDLDLLVKVCIEIRDVIREIITAEQSDDETYRSNIKHFLDHYTNDRLLEEIKQELPILAAAVSKR